MQSANLSSAQASLAPCFAPWCCFTARCFTFSSIRPSSMLFSTALLSLSREASSRELQRVVRRLPSGMAKACTTSTSVGTWCSSSGTEAEVPSAGSLAPRRGPGDVSITTLRLCVMDVTPLIGDICSCRCTRNLPVSASAPDEEGVSVRNEGGFGRERLGGDLVMAYDMPRRLANRNVSARSVEKNIFSEPPRVCCLWPLGEQRCSSAQPGRSSYIL
eukprot:scaffold45043_cov63-Phaeocystis_antarctica.AAC.4